MTDDTTVSATMREPELLGQTVVVIGGSAGIGLATARRARAEGADVVLTGRDPERLQQAAVELDAQRTAAFDANDAAALERFFQDLPTPIDHVMVTAGAPHYGPLLETDVAELRRSLSEHLVLTVEVARSAAGKVRPGGTLLFMGGTGGRRIGIGLGIVSTLTAAMPALTASLALELAPVRVNLIAAGFVDTPLSASLLGDDLEKRRDRSRASRSRSGACRHTRRRRRARRPHHDQHSAHRRDLRHRWRPATRRSRLNVKGLRPCAPTSHPAARFPTTSCPIHHPRKLSELQGADPMILTLARGHYCPKEHQQHLELATFQSKVAVGYTQIVTISTDEHHELQEFRASVGAQWTFLADPGRTIQQDLDIQEYTDPEHNPMIPHTLVLKPGLDHITASTTATGSGSPVSRRPLARPVRAVTSEIRPDWDLSTPGLREAWDAGDWSHFHGWNRPSAERHRAVMEHLSERDARVALRRTSRSGSGGDGT